MPNNAKKKCARCGYTKAWHGRVDGAPDHEFEMPSAKDIIEEARELVKLHESNGCGCRVCALLRALADEVERLREELEDAYLPRHRDELP